MFDFVGLSLHFGIFELPIHLGWLISLELMLILLYRALLLMYSFHAPAEHSIEQFPLEVLEQLLRYYPHCPQHYYVLPLELTFPSLPPWNVVLLILQFVSDVYSVTQHVIFQQYPT